MTQKTNFHFMHLLWRIKFFCTVLFFVLLHSAQWFESNSSIQMNAITSIWLQLLSVINACGSLLAVKGLFGIHHSFVCCYALACVSTLWVFVTILMVTFWLAARNPLRTADPRWRLTQCPDWQCWGSRPQTWIRQGCQHSRSLQASLPAQVVSAWSCTKRHHKWTLRC